MPYQVSRVSLGAVAHTNPTVVTVTRVTYGTAVKEDIAVIVPRVALGVVVDTNVVDTQAESVVLSRIALGAVIDTRQDTGRKRAAQIIG